MYARRNFCRDLERAQIINALEQETNTLHKLSKPEKIYLGNTNLCYSYAIDGAPDIGNIRETFFYNQLKVTEAVTFSKKTDFTINKKYAFEIGGKNKGSEQIRDLKNSYLALDSIETGYGKKIPLWLFGLLY